MLLFSGGACFCDSSHQQPTLLTLYHKLGGRFIINLSIHAAPQLFFDPPTPLGREALRCPASKQRCHDSETWIYCRFIGFFDTEFLQRGEAHYLGSGMLA